MEALWFVGWCVVAVALIRFARWRAARRERSERLPPPLAVLEFRSPLGGQELDQLGRRLQAQLAIRRAFTRDLGPDRDPVARA